MESGCKSTRFSDIIQIYSTIFLKFFWNEIAKALMLNDVVEHIFYVWGDCARKRRESCTLLYNTRARNCVKDRFVLG
ncbi:hypothetical protein BACFIN_08187 [Bacteroides finegoldii DSM 17565]|nr:hypothetical protein BACFIN_08187 [Bacteroides finegoldii DSM 17565]